MNDGLNGFTLTDTGNAERLVYMHGGNFRWVTDEEVFCVWNGTVWEKNRSGDLLLPFTKEMVRAIEDEKWQKSSEGAVRRRNMISLSKGEPDVYARRENFDARPMLLNVQNGTLELETGTLRDFCRGDFLTKKARVSYDPFATCPKFDEFMEYTFDGDKDLIHFMDKALGYTLTGNISESVFFLCYGTGCNGKTTLLELPTQIMGADFVTPAKFTTFVESKYADQSSYDFATFAGARMVIASEPRKSGRLNEELLKQLTGGEIVKTRQIYGLPFSFYPECKLWLAMNNKPRIVGTDDGIWRRVRLIPFTQRVPDEKKVKDFHKVLFAEEGAGILNRMLSGLAAWKEEGLTPPSSVAAATSEFRAAQNVIEDFFTSRCLTDKKNYKVEYGKLYKAYQAWAEEQNEYILRTNEFADELDRRCFIKKRSDTGFVRCGITLKAEPEQGTGLGFESHEAA